jgi:hypothetical protein
MEEVNTNRSTAGSRRTAWRLALRASAASALALSLAFVPPAQADDGTAPATPAGVLVLPNVRIEKAKPGQPSLATPRAASQGRAYKDADTGQLRAPTPEEMIQAASEPEAPSAPVEVGTLPDGTRFAALGEEAMAHSVVRRSADGTLHQECVAGSASAAKVLATPVTQERRDDDR